jgi:cob(I)alamin adenosyltransferase
MKIYTRTGDAGLTSLSGGERIPKSHARVDAYGSVDEIIAWIGLLWSCKENENRKEILLYIQDQLMKCSATLATRDTKIHKPEFLPEDGCVEKLEHEIDKMEDFLPPLRNFILPGGNILVSYCHIARCVCRRAERATLKLKKSEKIPDIVYKFLNRLSDYLFVLARLVGKELDIQEIIWHI